MSGVLAPLGVCTHMAGDSVLQLWLCAPPLVQRACVRLRVEERTGEEALPAAVAARGADQSAPITHRFVWLLLRPCLSEEVKARATLSEERI